MQVALCWCHISYAQNLALLSEEPPLLSGSASEAAAAAKRVRTTKRPHAGGGGLIVRKVGRPTTWIETGKGRNINEVPGFQVIA